MSAPVWLMALYWLAGAVCLAESLNKLERCRRLHECSTHRECATEALKAIAWGLLALGSGGILAAPLLHLPPPSLQDACFVVGFAVLIVRTRVKEG